MHMFSSCFSPAELYNSGCNGAEDKKDSFMWHKDLVQPSIGDFSIAVVQANQILEDQSQVKVGPYGTFIGVYDGHGGPEASQFITHHMFPNIESFAQDLGGMSSRVLQEAFNATEEKFLNLVDRSWRTKPHIASVGSCCLVGVICRNNLYIANLGDSRVVLGTRKKGRILATRLSEEHNAGNLDVRKELQAQHPDDSHIVVLKHGVWRVKGIIQVSRSIGDSYLKKAEFNRDPLFPTIGINFPLKRAILSAEPSLHEQTLVKDDRFLIFASDGLWEQMSDQEAVNIVHQRSRNGIAKRLIKTALKRAAKRRELQYAELRKIKPGTRRYFHDDISVIVMYLDQSSTHTQESSLKKLNDRLPVITPQEIFSSTSSLI